MSAAAAAAHVRSNRHTATPERAGRYWKAIATVLAIVGGIWWGHESRLDKLGGSGAEVAASELDDAGIRRVASTVRAEQVVMYSTTECGNCAQAKSWLSSYGFAFTECNMSVESRCVGEFQALRASGTPYLVVRGPRGEHHMKDGFDSDEFLAALQG